MQYTNTYKQQDRIKISRITDLQPVLGGPVVYRKLTEFLSQTEALTNIFRWDKIKSNLDAWLQKDSAYTGIKTNISSND